VRLPGLAGGSECRMRKFTTNPIDCLLALGLCEIFASWWLWGSLPTDTVAVYYPTAWSYIGEHLLIWLVFLVPVAVLFHAASKRGLGAVYLGGWRFILIFGVAALLEFLSSSYRWYLATEDGTRFPWWTGGFGSYLLARLVPLLISLTFAMAIALWRSHVRAAKGGNLRPSPRAIGN
jgi:hypothetical protein